MWNTPHFQLYDILLLVILGVIFTGIAHFLFINGLKNVKVQTASIITCLEPVYGIVAAAIFLGEIPLFKVVLGSIVIMGTAFYTTLKG